MKRKNTIIKCQSYLISINCTSHILTNREIDSVMNFRYNLKASPKRPKFPNITNWLTVAKCGQKEHKNKISCQFSHFLLWQIFTQFSHTVSNNNGRFFLPRKIYFSHTRLFPLILLKNTCCRIFSSSSGRKIKIFKHTRKFSLTKKHFQKFFPSSSLQFSLVALER